MYGGTAQDLLKKLQLRRKTADRKSLFEMASLASAMQVQRIHRYLLLCLRLPLYGSILQ